MPAHTKGATALGGLVACRRGDKMKRRLSINVRGKSGAMFGFQFYGDPKYLDEWRAEGFEIDEVLNTVPVWAARLGLARIWCRAQDAWQWLRLW